MNRTSLTPSRTRLAAAISLALLVITAGAVSADDVHLTNGRTIEGVIAEIDGDDLVVRLPGGQIVLPRSHVARVVKSSSTYAEYLDRRAGLDPDSPESAAAWVELARWARDREFQSGYRQAALTAARLDPELPGVAAVMRDLGYVLDEQLGRWIAFEEYQRARGLVQVDGVWVPRLELERQRRAMAQEEADRRSERRLERLSETVETLVLAQAVESLERPDPPEHFYRTPIGYPVVVVPGVIKASDLDLLSRRLPGSRLPLRLPGVDTGKVDRSAKSAPRVHHPQRHSRFRRPAHRP